MDFIAKIGEYVIYTGDTRHARDNITRKLMNDSLIPGNIYQVNGIRNWGIYKGYYIMGNNYYPPKSFVKDLVKSMKIKYDLR